MGGRGSGRWKQWERHGNSYKTGRMADAVSIDIREVVRARTQDGWTPLGTIRWLQHNASARARDGRRITIDQGVLTVHDYTGLPYPRYAILVASCDHGFMRRQWLYCPQCARPRSRLFISQGTVLQCRVCAKLQYASQRLTARKRAALRRDKIGRQMFWLWDSSKKPPERQRGQHRKRHARLLAAWHNENNRATARVRRSRGRYEFGRGNDRWKLFEDL